MKNGFIENFQIMAKPSGSVCNMNCSYCYYLEKEHLYPSRKNRWKMSINTLENYVKKTISGQRSNVVDFIWQGGEPTLMGIEFYREAVRLQNQHRGNKQIKNFFQTNGISIDERWAIFFKENHFLVGLSIDGDRISQDHYRHTRSGESTYDAVIRGVDALKKQQVAFNTLTVVNAENVKRPLDVYNFLKRIGSRYMQFIPLVERCTVGTENIRTLVAPGFTGQCHVTEWSVPAKAYGMFLNKIFDRWVMNDLGTVFVMNFEQTMAKMTGQNSACVINETCGANLIVEANGDIYSCDHFVYPEYKIGNINHDDPIQLINSTQNRAFGERKLTTLSKACLTCAVRHVCNGGCPKQRFVISAEGRADQNYLCEGFSLHLHHSLPVMTHLLALIRQGTSLANTKKAIKRAYVRKHKPG